MEFPATLGACIDALYTKRSERLALSKTLDELKEVESQYAEHIINSFSKTEILGAKGDLATASIKQSIVYQLDNWDQFIEFVANSKAYELLRKQPSSTACRERFEAGQPVPGINPFTKIDLSLTKASK